MYILLIFESISDNCRNMYYIYRDIYNHYEKKIIIINLLFITRKMKNFVIFCNNFVNIYINIIVYIRLL